MGANDRRGIFERGQVAETWRSQRWDSFKRDVAYFRNAHGVKRWEEAQTDHGYNATPVWNILGTILEAILNLQQIN